MIQTVVIINIITSVLRAQPDMSRVKCGLWKCTTHINKTKQVQTCFLCIASCIQPYDDHDRTQEHLPGFSDYLTAEEETQPYYYTQQSHHFLSIAKPVCRPFGKRIRPWRKWAPLPNNSRPTRIPHIVFYSWPPLWSSGQSFWLQIQRSRVRFPALTDFLSISGYGTGSTQPREVNWGTTWIKSSGSGPENRD